MPEATDAQVVLLCGVSGSGKTWFARKLEAQGYTRLSADRYLWDLHGPEFASWPLPKQQQAFMEASASMEKLLAKSIAEGKKVVVDSTLCKRIKRDSLRRVCAGAGVAPLFVWFDVPLPVLKQRLAARGGSGPDDQIVSTEQIENFFRGFECPEADETDVITYTI